MAGASASPNLPPRRILVRGVNWLGDAVMTTPALRRLREHFPEAHVTLLTPHKLADLWRSHPAVDDWIDFDPQDGVLATSRKLRAGRFDVSLVLPNSPRSALEVFLARIPQRIGYARPWRNVFLTRAVASRAAATRMRKRPVAEIKRLVAADRAREPDSVGAGLTNPAGAHQMHEYLHLVAALGANPGPVAPQLFVAPAEVEAVRKKFGLEESSGLVLGLNAGAEYGPAKRWPASHFIAVAQQIHAQNECVWLLFGGHGDRAITGSIAGALQASGVPFYDLAGKTSLRELMALLTRCRVLLTNDTGPMHVAAALGTSVVAPFGSTSPELTGPGLPGEARHRLLKSDAVCAPCFRRQCPIDFRCLNGLRVERVVEAVRAALAGR